MKFIQKVKVKKLLALLLTIAIIFAYPGMARADYIQPQAPSTYFDPSSLNANNPDPLSIALSKVSPSPFGQNTPDLPSNKAMNPGSVDLAQGKLNLSAMDLKIASNKLPMTLQRTYNSSSTQMGHFGIGWDFNYNRSITMYHEYAILEHIGDQGSRTYKYTKNNPSVRLSSFDGDNRIQYPLDDGYYTPVQSSNTAALTRNPDVTYSVREKDGTTYIYNRYLKSWAPSPMDGKLSQITDANGNKLTLQYDGQRNLTQVTDTAGRTLTFA